MSKTRAKCGTHAGYVSHYYHGEEPCAACRKAQSDYKRAWNLRRKEKASMTARKPAAKRTAARKPASHDAILQNAVTAVVNMVRAGRSSAGHAVPTDILALRLQVAAEEYARVEGAA